jgi:hypothetical protein
MAEFYLALFGLVLFFNIEGIGGIIAISCVGFVMLVYFFAAVHPLSRYNIWLERTINRLNMRSLSFMVGSEEDLKKGIIILSVSVIDLILFLVFQLTGFIVIANVIVIVGKIFRVIGFRKLSRGLDNQIKSHNWLLYVIIALVPTYPVQISLFVLNILAVVLV